MKYVNTCTLCEQDVEFFNVKVIMLYDWQPHAIRKRGRPKIRWKDDVREDLKDLGIYNWITRTQDRSSWKEIVEQAKGFKK
jgi:hypothetical protein